MRSAASLLAASLVTGCAAVEPSVVRVPVPVPCVVELPSMPTISTDAELRAMSDYRLVLVIARERLQLIGYSAEVRASAAACVER